VLVHRNVATSNAADNVAKTGKTDSATVTKPQSGFRIARLSIPRRILSALARAGTAREWADPLPSARARITTAQFLDGYRVPA